jgi:hypothetical protein
MASLYDAYGINQKDAEEGKWFTLVPGEKPIRFKIRRFKSQKSREVRERLEAPYRAPGKPFVLPVAVSEQMLREQMAEAIIADWENVTDRDGNQVPYSKEAALKFLTDLPELSDELAQLCLNIDNYREGREGDITKN